MYSSTFSLTSRQETRSGWVRKIFDSQTFQPVASHEKGVEENLNVPKEGSRREGIWGGGGRNSAQHILKLLSRWWLAASYSTGCFTPV
jgi:hypothetical protein